jgi:hypothetical protein
MWKRMFAAAPALHGFAAPAPLSIPCQVHTASGNLFQRFF